MGEGLQQVLSIVYSRLPRRWAMDLDKVKVRDKARVKIWVRHKARVKKLSHRNWQLVYMILLRRLDMMPVLRALADLGGRVCQEDTLPSPRDSSPRVIIRNMQAIQELQELQEFQATRVIQGSYSIRDTRRTRRILVRLRRRLLTRRDSMRRIPDRKVICRMGIGRRARWGEGAGGSLVM
jgi:hypothetical protein